MYVGTRPLLLINDLKLCGVYSMKDQNVAMIVVWWEKRGSLTESHGENRFEKKVITSIICDYSDSSVGIILV